jgi:two-component system cell cycle sensor histidine kinase/response regulator CckA
MNHWPGTTNPNLEWQSAFDAVGDYVCLVDAAGIIVRANPAALSEFGEGGRQLVGQPYADVFGVRAGSSISAIQVRDPAAAAPFTTETHLAALTGNYQVSAHPLEHEGTRTGAILVIRNLSQHEQSKAMLREGRGHYHALAESAPVAIYETDAQGRCIYVNKIWRGLTGLSQAQAEGDGWQAAVHPEDRAKVSEAWRRRSDSHEPWSHEYRFQSPTGQITWILGKSQALVDTDGTKFGYMGVNVDITERKQAEADKLDLERRVQRAEKLESLSQLAGGIAHDFNNILMIIEGNADLARDEVPPNSMVADHLDEISQACTNAASLANQMLAYSGKGRFVNEAVDLSRLVSSLEVQARSRVPAQTKLVFDLAKDLDKTIVDANQIRQLVISLVTNAAEAIGDEEGTITVRTGMVHCDGAYLDSMTSSETGDLSEPLAESDYAFIEIADTGCGMEEDTIKKVFDPFFTRKFTGRGLGLSAVLGIVRGHKAGLEIDSEVDKGTRFRVLFAAEAPTKTSAVVYVAPAAKAKSQAARPTILMVDDDESVRRVSKAMLKQMGFEVLLAEDGLEGLQVVQSRGADLALVLLDLTMPRMNGQEAFREIRKLQPNLAVVLCSGYTEQQATQEFTGQPLAGFMQKPFGIKALRAKITEVLQTS